MTRLLSPLAFVGRMRRPGPVAIAATVVGILAVLGTGWGLTTLETMDRSVARLDDEGGRLETGMIGQYVALQMKLFATQEEMRLSAGGDPKVPPERLAFMDMLLRLAHDAIVKLEPSGGDGQVKRQLGASIENMHGAFLAYVNSNSADDLAALVARAQEAETRAAIVAIDRSERLGSGWLDLGDLVSQSRWVLLGSAAFIFVLPVGLIVWMGRRYEGSIAMASGRQASLLEANSSLERRDGQFRALYRVVSEVNETLSLKYIGNSAVREARRLVDADLTVLRILEGTTLRVLDQDGERPIEGHADHAADIELGEGLVGRAAKSGRTATVQAETAAQGLVELLAGSTGSRSGLIVPLIVGARVVGTLSCWSSEANNFSDDDLQMLELMASQVATAIAAADTHEASDRDAHLDALTGLPNRRQLIQDAKYEFDSAVKRGRKIAVAMVDIDHFKRFNDAHGHQAGDVALQQVTTTLAEELRREDRIYRYGGEEFLVVFDALTTEQATQASERLRRAVETATVPGGSGVEARVTISLGLAAGQGDERDFAELLERADEALYTSKEEGRNRVTVAYCAKSMPLEPVTLETGEAA